MKNSAAIIPVSSADCQVNSWKSQLKSAFSNPVELLQYIGIDPADNRLNLDHFSKFAMRVPRPFADKMKKGDINDPLLKQVLSIQDENLIVDGYVRDPLQEQSTKQPGLLHKYHGRVLLILTGSCAVNCRYCFRREFPYQSNVLNDKRLQKNIEYIAHEKSISEVILSGGDPLLVSDKQLVEIIRQLEAIPHIKRLRIHTRLPVVIPQRVTTHLIEMLAATKLSTSIVIHSNHANEIDDKTGSKLAAIVRSGTVVLNQAVLLKDINNDAAVLSELNQRLFEYQVLPYYLHLLDPVAGSAHFDSCRNAANEIMVNLSKILPGYLVPKLAVEEPFKPSKTIIM